MPDHMGDETMQVAEMFGDVARMLAEHQDLDATLHRIVQLAVENLEACEYAGISFVERGRITSPASTNDIPRVIDCIQAEVDEGPCVDAIKRHEIFRTGDLEHEARWPKFSVRAHGETGVCSILALRLFIEADTMGALNLYSTQRDAFDDGDVALAAVFAAHAAVAMSGVRREDKLEKKAVSRDVIGQAKGLLRAGSNISDDEAFDILRRASQRLNVKVVDVAEKIAHPPANPAPTIE